MNKNPEGPKSQPESEQANSRKSPEVGDNAAIKIARNNETVVERSWKITGKNEDGTYAATNLTTGEVMASVQPDSIVDTGRNWCVRRPSAPVSTNEQETTSQPNPAAIEDTTAETRRSFLYNSIMGGIGVAAGGFVANRVVKDWDKPDYDMSRDIAKGLWTIEMPGGREIVANASHDRENKPEFAGEADAVILDRDFKEQWREFMLGKNKPGFAMDFRIKEATLFSWFYKDMAADFAKIGTGVLALAGISSEMSLVTDDINNHVFSRRKFIASLLRSTGLAWLGLPFLADLIDTGRGQESFLASNLHPFLNTFEKTQDCVLAHKLEYLMSLDFTRPYIAYLNKKRLTRLQYYLEIGEEARIEFLDFHSGFINKYIRPEDFYSVDKYFAGKTEEAKGHSLESERIELADLKNLVT